MFGIYLSSDDEQYLDLITDELDQFNSMNDSSSILLFPSLSSRHRLLLHRLRDSNYPNLFSFSVGEEKNTRRTIICFKSQLMEETIESSNASSTKPTTPSKDGESTNTKRRPDQQLYKPPRRSVNAEPVSPAPAPAPSPAPVIETEPEKETPKPAKAKTARPSAEPYVPPSRRNQMNSQDTSAPSPPTSATARSSVKDTTIQQEELKKDQKNDDEEEEEWEQLLDKSDESITKDFIQEIQSKFKEVVQIKKPVHDYSQWTVDELQVKEGELAHVLEVSNFPSTLRTEDLHNAFTTLTRSLYDIKWVDETHALVVFPDATSALDALQMDHPMFRLSPMSQAAAVSKKKAKSISESLQPYKARPQTSSLTANRRICAALGLKNPMSVDKARSERQKIEAARKQKARDKEEQKAVWDGEFLPATSSS